MISLPSPWWQLQRVADTKHSSLWQALGKDTACERARSEAKLKKHDSSLFPMKRVP